MHVRCFTGARCAVAGGPKLAAGAAQGGGERAVSRRWRWHLTQYLGLCWEAGWGQASGCALAPHLVHWIDGRWVEASERLHGAGTWACSWVVVQGGWVT
jgi:hypothetical protein